MHHQKTRKTKQTGQDISTEGIRHTKRAQKTTGQASNRLTRHNIKREKKDTPPERHTTDRQAWQDTERRDHVYGRDANTTGQIKNRQDIREIT